MGKDKSGSTGKIADPLTVVSVAIAIVSLLMTAVEKWVVFPTWLRYLLVVVLLLLSVGLLVILFRAALSERLRKVVQDYQARQAIVGQSPTMEELIRDLEKVVAGGHVYSLAAIVQDLGRNWDRFEEMQAIDALLGIVRKWVTHLPGQWELARRQLGVKAAQHLLVELRFLIQEVGCLAKQCAVHMPQSGGEPDELHGEPASYAEVTHKWKQFCAAYDRLVDDYRSVNKRCARHVPGLAVFDFDKL